MEYKEEMMEHLQRIRAIMVAEIALLDDGETTYLTEIMVMAQRRMLEIVEAEIREVNNGRH